jgi:hypothetical protein
MAGPRRNLLVIGAVVPVLVLTACGSGSGGRASQHPSTSTRASTTTSTVAVTTTTTAAPASTTTTTRAPAGPAAVTTLRARAGGGSGEVVVSWSGVAGATHYRVARAVAPSGPFTTVADVNAASGTGSHVPSVVNLYLDQGSYVVVDVPTGSASRRWYYAVTAAADGASAPQSAVVCGAPPGSSCA